MPKAKARRPMKTFDGWCQIRVRVRHRNSLDAENAIKALLEDVAEDVTGLLVQEVDTIPCECGGQIEYSSGECDECDDARPFAV